MSIEEQTTLEKIALELAWLRSEVVKLTQAVNQRPVELPTYVPFTAVPHDERIADIGGISLREMRYMTQEGRISEEGGHLKNISKGTKKPIWLVHVPALVEKLKCDRNLT